MALVGGVGYLLGRVRRADAGHRGINQEILESTWDGVGEYIQLISGVASCSRCHLQPDGVAAEWVQQFPRLKKHEKFGEPSLTIELADVVRRRAEPTMTSGSTPRRCVVDGLTVRYGGSRRGARRRLHARTRVRSPA